MFYVLLDHLIGYVAGGSDKVAYRPEMLSPVALPEFGELKLDFT